MPETRNAKSASSSSSGCDGLNPSTNTEYVSMATLREMLDMQERIFRNLFESVLSSVNIRIDEIVKSVAELKASLEYSQQDIDDLWKFTNTLADMEDELDEVQRSLKDKEDKIEYLENQSRRNNIRVEGIPEDEHETWSDTETKVKHVLGGKIAFGLRAGDRESSSYRSKAKIRGSK